MCSGGMASSRKHNRLKGLCAPMVRYVQTSIFFVMRGSGVRVTQAAPVFLALQLTASLSIVSTAFSAGVTLAQRWISEAIPLGSKAR